MKTVLHWFRRDLRVADNTALAEAARRAERVVTVFVLDDAILRAPDMGAARVAFLLGSLRVLAKNLSALGRCLIVRHGEPEKELLAAARETGAEAVFCNRDYEPYCRHRDGRVAAALNAAGIGFEIFKDSVLWEEDDLLTKAGTPFTVFTPYAKAWRIKSIPRPRPRPTPAPGGRKTAVPLSLPKDAAELGFSAAPSIPEAGEDAALAALELFVRDGAPHYGERRDFPALNGTSRLSPHLHFGTINVRTVLSELRKAAAGFTPEQARHADVFLNELIWREFYIQVLAHFPRVERGCFRAGYDGLGWSENKDHFQAWCAGQTGYPVVDAAMRCLHATGWMHNRLRMVAAMFLAKDLLLPWQWGERWFMQRLCDGDLAANNGGWQWCAGTGTDAAPYFRIFNPVSQGEKFDPEGAFVRRWVPELASLPSAVIHRPWETGADRQCGYVRRVVIHEEQRPKCLAMFQKARVGCPAP